jgi:PKD domain
VRAFSAALAALALIALPASALASDEVRLEPEGAAARTFALSGLGEPDVRERSYTVGGSRVTVTGWSLDRVLRAGRVDPYRFGSLEIALTDGSVPLSRDQATEPDSFPEGPPVFWVEDGQARFLRPAGSDGSAARLATGGPVTIGLSRQAELTVEASASSRRTKPGRPVTFTASVSGAGASEADVSWYFDDGHRGSGRRVTHRFRRPGTYDVIVGATTSPGDPGADASVTVQVGKPPAGGPERKGGGTSDEADAPDSGVATGDGGGAGSGSEGAGSPSDDAGSGSGADGSARPEPERSARERAARDRAAREGRSGQASRARSVSGIELASLAPLSSQAGRDALRAARRGTLDEEVGEPGPGIPAGLWWGLGGVALLALGGWREARLPRSPTAR